MKKIPLNSRSGPVGYALVDDEDYEYLSQWKWHLTGGYAVCTTIKCGVTYMHSIVNCTLKGMSTDHINRDKLDNRRQNLRTCNQSQNMANGPLQKNNTSLYRGVVWDKDRLKYRAQIQFEGKPRNLGRYASKREAALAYNAAANVLFGPFAVLNEVT